MPALSFSTAALARRIAVAGAGLLLAAAPAFALDAPLAADAHVNIFASTSNFGAHPALNVGPGSTALLRFDLSGLPSGTTAFKVAKANLVLFVNRVGVPGALELQTVLSPWSEGAVTAATAPVTSGVGTGQLLQVPMAGQFVSVDVTAQVQQWVANPANNFGWALTSALSAANTVVFLDSKENTATGHVARLDITLADQGAKGDKGDTGPRGATGAAGAKGDTGAQGVQGAKGDTGPKGADGVSGYQRVSVARNVAANFLAAQSVACPSGKRVLGGGVQLVSSLTAGQQVKTVIHQSFPASDSVWTVFFSNTNSVAIDITVWATCVTG